MEKKAVLYLRRSDASNDSPRVISLDVQLAACQAHAEANNFQIADIIRDDGVSGGDRERFERILATVRKTRAKIIVVYHLDRFGRDTVGVIEAMRKLSRSGVQLHVAGQGPVEISSSSGLLSTGILALISEHYRLLCSERQRAAKARLRLEGRVCGAIPPLGYRHENGRVVPDEREQRVIALVVAARQQNVPWRDIPTVLARLGFLSRAGKPFSDNTLRDAYRRRIQGTESYSGQTPSPHPTPHATYDPQTYANSR